MQCESQPISIRDYGSFDPLKQTVEHINKCVCGNVLTEDNIHFEAPTPAQMGLPADAEVWVNRFFVKCPCGNVGPATKSVMHAVLQWNIDSSEKPHYTSLPLFKVAELPPTEALKKLQAIREDLKLRIEDCEQRMKDSDTTKHPGPRFYAKLAAYRSWNHYAIKLAFLATQTSTNKGN